VAVQKSRLTVKTLRDRVRGDLGMRSNALLTDEDIDAWALAWQTECAALTHWYRTSDLVNTTADTALYDLPTDCIALEEVRHNDLPLTLVRLVDFYRDNPNWRADDSGTPTHYYLRGTTAYGLYPTPDTTATDEVELFYTAFPPALTLNSDTYYIPTALEEGLVDYCKLMASEKDASGEGARRVDLYTRRVEGWRQKVMSYVGNVAEGEMTVVGGGGSSSFGDLGDIISTRTIPAP
jgi:hypothetical protein